MRIKWDGVRDFGQMNEAIIDGLRVAVAERITLITKRQRDRALHNFGEYKIGLVTGRSRALYAITPLTSVFAPMTKITNMQIEVGYTVWPTTDKFSPTQEIPFYPATLNYGSDKMPARPFHSAAVDATEPEYYKEMDEALNEALRKATNFGGTTR